VSYLERVTQLPVLGVVPYLYGLDLDAEDAVQADVKVDPSPHEDAACVRIGVLRLPHISNFTDFAPLARIDGVAVHYLYRPRELHGYSAIVLPGSKSVIADLQWLRETGLSRRLLDYHAAGGKLLGVCGGFQMLGAELHDEQQVESGSTSSAGLGLIDAVTHYRQPKIVRRTRARTAGSGVQVSGYEIHAGRTQVRGHSPLLMLEQNPTPDDPRGEPEGVRDDQSRIWATVLHGVFDSPEFCDEFLRWLEPKWSGHAGQSRLAAIDAEIERFAKHVHDHLDWQRVLGWLGVGALKARG
jgi:adenosylcobyric acid synthase